ncbi:hypothetical protein D3C79_757760 [compost metagenome]
MRALNRVDLPTFGRPTIPIDRLIILLLYQRWAEKLRLLFTKYINNVMIALSVARPVSRLLSEPK